MKITRILAALIATLLIQQSAFASAELAGPLSDALAKGVSKTDIDACVAKANHPPHVAPVSLTPTRILAAFNSCIAPFIEEAAETKKLGITVDQYRAKKAADAKAAEDAKNADLAKSLGLTVDQVLSLKKNFVAK